MKNRKGKNQTDAPAAKPFSIEQYNSRTDRRTSQNGSLMFSAFVFVVALVLAIAAGYLITGAFTVWVVLVGFALACLAEMSIHIAMQWEKVVVLRFGKFSRSKGPGLYFTIPFIEQTALKADQRIMVTGFGAEETLTSDLVPINVDAVLFWMVWDAEKACLEVENYYNSVSLVAQTALRDAIGRASVSEVAIRRNQLDQELQEVIEERTSLWGITVLSVEIRDIVIPQELQEVMSTEAQADTSATLYSENLLGYLLGRAHYQFLGGFRTQLRERGLSDADFFVLSLLSVREPLSACEIASHIAYTGIDVGRTRCAAYVLSGALAGLCGYLWVSRYAVAYVDVAAGFELDVVAACVIGWVSIMGGIGSVGGAVLGALFLGIVKNALPVVDISPFWQLAISGTAIIVAVAFNARAERRKGRVILKRAEHAA